MGLSVREFGAGDAAEAAAVVRAAQPFRTVTAESLAWQIARAPQAQRHRALVVEDDGRLLGIARAGLIHDSSAPGLAFVKLDVHPADRERGAGSALLGEAEGHLAGLGARVVYAWAQDAGSATFAARRGYRPGRSARVQRLGLAPGALPAPPPVPPGAELRGASDFTADPRPVYEADAEALADEPGDVSADAVSYEDWRTDTWDHPDVDHALSAVVVVDGVVAAVSLAETDGRGRYWSAWTGTRRAYRGRGLARLAKYDSLRRARAAGCTEAFTSNDAGNEPMLAVNAWLGYQRCATMTRYLRELGD
jgi:GNAT superfamily N-acetyltransferase